MVSEICESGHYRKALLLRVDHRLQRPGRSLGARLCSGRRGLLYRSKDRHQQRKDRLCQSPNDFRAIHPRFHPNGFGRVDVAHLNHFQLTTNRGLWD